MKKLSHLFFAAALLLTACDDSLHVDMQEEIRNRPVVSLSTSDGTSVSGFVGNYCTDVVCFENPPIDFSALTFTPITNGEDLTFTVDFFDPINTISLRTYNKAGDITHRELPYTQVDEKTFLFEEPFPSEENQITLHIKVDFVNEGLTNYYYPLQLQ